jgi:hypothetical protein
MDEQTFMQYWNVIQQYYSELSEHITAIEKKVDDGLAETDRQVNELRTTVYDEIINPANEYIAGQEKEARFNDFNEKFGEKLGAFNKDLSALEGDDFDVVREAFDKYDDFEGDKMGEDEYVEALVEQLGDKLTSIKTALGVPEDTEIAVEQTEDGETVVTTEDGEVVASTETEDGEGEEELPKEEVETTDELEEGEAEDDPEEVAAFEEELKNLK